MNALIAVLYAVISLLEMAVAFGCTDKDGKILDAAYDTLREAVKIHDENKKKWFITSRDVRCPFMNESEIYDARYLGKINAVRDYKTRTGLSLMDSKVSVEEQMDLLGYDFYRY